MKKKIAYLIPQYPAISETFIADQIDYFCQRGYDLTIFSFLRPKINKIVKSDKRAKLVYLGRSQNPFLVIKMLLSFIIKHRAVLARIIKQTKSPSYIIKYLFWTRPFINSKFDLVHCHFGPTATKYCLLNKFLGSEPKFITTFYGYDISYVIKQKGKGIYDEVNKHSLVNFVMSNDMRERLIKLGFSPDKIVINPPGVDLSLIKESIKSVGDSEEVKILSVGRFVEKKGFADLLRAIAYLKTLTAKKFKCLIVGFGPEKSALLTLKSNLGLDDFVEFGEARPIEEIYQLFKQSHLFVQPSKTASNGDME
jgi:colanic acid/amylovoran biosynthesis glycosyltransferase